MNQPQSYDTTTELSGVPAHAEHGSVLDAKVVVRSQGASSDDQGIYGTVALHVGEEVRRWQKNGDPAGLVFEGGPFSLNLPSHGHSVVVFAEYSGNAQDESTDGHYPSRSKSYTIRLTPQR